MCVFISSAPPLHSACYELSHVHQSFLQDPDPGNAGHMPRHNLLLDVPLLLRYACESGSSRCEVHVGFSP